jgi:hypothetical protein
MYQRRVEVAFTLWDDLDCNGPDTSRRSSLQFNGIVPFDSGPIE